MKLSSFFQVLTIAALPVLFGHAAMAADVPPATSRSLSDILSAAPTIVTKAEFDDGFWEVKGCTDDACEKLYIDPQSAQVTRRKSLERVDQPKSQATPTARELVKRIEAADIGTITEIDYDKGSWKVELVKPLD